MQYHFDFICGQPAQKPLEIEPFNESKAAHEAFERFVREREMNAVVHSVRRRGMAIAKEGKRG